MKLYQIWYTCAGNDFSPDESVMHHEIYHHRENAEKKMEELKNSMEYPYDKRYWPYAKNWRIIEEESGYEVV